MPYILIKASSQSTELLHYYYISAAEYGSVYTIKNHLNAISDENK